MVSDTELKSLLTLDAAHEDALTLRLRSGNPCVLLLFAHVIEEESCLPIGLCWLEGKVGLVKTVVDTRWSGHGPML
jgi:hypothetical protein